MASGTSLVGNSKVMHHMLPNIVPPIEESIPLLYSARDWAASEARGSRTNEKA